MAEFIDDDLHGSRFLRVDLSGTRLHDVDLRGMKLTDGWVDDVSISGYIGTLTVNDVEVGAYVRAQLDERHPQRRLLKPTDGDGLRVAWTMIEERAAATSARARALPAGAVDESVDGEFSYVQTLRHLVHATDLWITGPVLAEPEPFHPLGYPSGDPEAGRRHGLDIDARPSLDEVLAVRRGRMDRVAELVRSATPEELARTVADRYGGETTVLRCLHVVLDEEWEHHQYANRDLDVLAGGERPRP